MVRVRTLTIAMLVVAVVGAVAATGVAASESAAPNQQTNLLHNPGIEGPYIVSQVHVQDGQFRDNIFTPEGWVTWWRIGNGEGGDWGQPEVQVISADHPNYGYDAALPRIFSGNQSLKFFTMYRPHDGGLYQYVSGLQPNSTVQFSAIAHAWTCDNHDRIGYTCMGVDDQIHLSVGIDPNGNCDPFSPSVIWAPEGGGMIAPDQWAVIGPVSAQVGGSGAVCVFTRSLAKWGYAHLDSYWDDHSLVVTRSAVRPTAVPTSTPRPTPTPRADGSIVHIVESGDTLSIISRMYGLDLDSIKGLNDSTLDEIEVGQEIVIAPPVATATPEPIFSVCVAAFNDRDNNQAWDSGAEEMLPGGHFTLSDAGGVIGEYVSDGLNEPYCFIDLAPGSYDVALVPPSGYDLSGASSQSAEASADAPPVVALGCTRGDAPMSSPEPTATPAEIAMDIDAALEEGLILSDDDTTESAGQIVLSVVSDFSGVLMLILAVGLGALFYFERKKA